MAPGPLLAEVAVPVPVPRTFHYRVPAALDARVQPGVRVEVPFGPRRVRAYCVGRTGESPVAQLKPILSVLDPSPVLDAGMLDLGRWIAARYHASLGDVLEAVLPAGIRRASAASRQEQIVRLAVRPDHAGEVIVGLRRRARAQAAVLEALCAREGHAAPMGQLRRVAPTAPAAVQRLAERGLVTIEIHERAVAPGDGHVGDPGHVEPHVCTPAQGAALAAVTARLDAAAHAVVLLHGVTGSGKTEVYLQAIAHTVAAGRQAILLVPEIALTPQTVGRIAARFPRCAVLHSHLPDAERRREWERIRAGHCAVVVGARSAVFAPGPRLGWVVIDEEHETSFKQDAVPRYHARAVAIERARTAGAVVVLGSATPSLESFAAAQDGRYTLAELPERVAGGVLPPVEIVDLMRDWDETGRVSALSRPLRAALHETLAAGEQAILFLNRRGYATSLRCPRCGHVWRCAACDVAMNFHKTVDRILCHYCGQSAPTPTRCPECRHDRVRFLGSGTQRLEQELAAGFAGARVARMDSDAMRKVGAYDEVLQRVRDGAVDILVGTQMVAKGHDFPNVTLVGVVFADTGLQLPDFRSAERTFQIVAQVAGRAGRGARPGRVIVQTLTPGHYSIACAAAHDYAGFARHELGHREAAGYPPFRRLARLLLTGPKLEAVQGRAGEFADAIRAAAPPAAEVLGPAPAPMERLQGRHRVHLLVKAPGHAALEQALAPLAEPRFQRKARNITLTVDIDPMSLL